MEQGLIHIIVEMEKGKHQLQSDLRSVLQEVDLRFYLPGF